MDVAQEWFCEIKSKRKPSTYIKYHFIFSSYIENIFGNVLLSEITSISVKEKIPDYLPDSLYFFYPCPGSRVNSGIASIYGRFRYFSQLHNFTFRHFSSHLFAPKSSKSSSKFFRKSGRQPFHFLAGRSISSVCIVVQGHIDAVVPHDILQCFRVHSGVC